MQAIPLNEAERLEALQRQSILDPPPEFAYDAITEIAAQSCECPVTVIGFADDALLGSASTPNQNRFRHWPLPARARPRKPS